MGVAGAGKTAVGSALAALLGWEFFDADDFHSPENVAKMRSGIPLTDADREPWLATLRGVVAQRLSNNSPAVLACSALRRSYRSALLPANAPEHSVAFVHLDITPELAEQRLKSRPRHYMPPSLVASQFAALEEPNETEAVRLDGSRPTDELVAQIRAAYALSR